MPDLAQRIRRSTDALHLPPVDVGTLHRRATRTRRLERGAIGVGVVALLAIAVAGVATTTSGAGSGPEVGPVGGEEVGAGWDLYALPRGASLTIDPTRIEAGIRSADEVDVVATLDRSELPASAAADDDDVLRGALAVTGQGDVVIVAGHEATVVTAEGGRFALSPAGCPDVARFSVVAARDQRLYLTGPVGGDGWCATTWPIGAGAGAREGPADTRFGASHLGDNLFVDGGWWVEVTGDQRPRGPRLPALGSGPVLPPGWYAVDDGGGIRLSPDGRTAPDGLTVDVEGITEDPNLLRRTVGWTFTVDVMGRPPTTVAVAQERWLFQDAPGSAGTVVSAGAGRRLAVFEDGDGEGWMLAFTDAGEVGAASFEGTGLGRATRGFAPWTVGEDGHLYWVEAEAEEVRVLRYRFPLP